MIAIYISCNVIQSTNYNENMFILHECHLCRQVETRDTLIASQRPHVMSKFISILYVKTESIDINIDQLDIGTLWYSLNVICVD